MSKLVPSAPPSPPPAGATVPENAGGAAQQAAPPDFALLLAQTQAHAPPGAPPAEQVARTAAAEGEQAEEDAPAAAEIPIALTALQSAIPPSPAPPAPSPASASDGDAASVGPDGLVDTMCPPAPHADASPLAVDVPAGLTAAGPAGPAVLPDVALPAPPPASVNPVELREAASERGTVGLLEPAATTEDARLDTSAGTEPALAPRFGRDLAPATAGGTPAAMDTTPNATDPSPGTTEGTPDAADEPRPESVRQTAVPAAPPSQAPTDAGSPGSQAVAAAASALHENPAPQHGARPAQTATAEAPAPRPVTVRELPETLQATIRVAVRERGAQARIVLRPAELGEVDIRLRYHDGGVSATVTAASEAAADTLVQAAPDLRRSLEAQGLTLVALDVRHSGAEQRGPHDDPDVRQEPSRDRGENRAELSPTDVEIDVEPSRLPLGSRLIDVLA